ncbi:MAG: family 43 glycosylhydrolase [Streptococcaceae bacterium]|jgi:alpha-N-arabinofuranosidase|nr:family 43 glycosylhydrolase [Streptococcaceae bacterium]
MTRKNLNSNFDEEPHSRGSRSQRHQKSRGPLIAVISVLVLVVIAAAVFIFLQQSNSNKAAGKKDNGNNTSTYKFTEFTGNNFLGENTIKVDANYFAFSSDADNTPHVRLATSTDNVNFTPSDADILPTLPSWSATPNKLTRPGIWKMGDQYIIYANFVNGASGLFAIGAATSPTVEGPYTPVEEPLLLADYGVLSSYFDVSIYQEDGKNYMLYATDQNLGYDIWIQQLSDDGLGIIGDPTKLVDSTTIDQYKKTSKVALVERPALVKAPDGKYVLIYSADKVDLDTAYIGYAVSDSITGPYTNGGSFVSNDQMNNGLQGPSEPAVFQDDDKNYLIFNAWKGKHDSWNGIGNTATWLRYRVEFTWKDGHIPSLKK